MMKSARVWIDGFDGKIRGVPVIGLVNYVAIYLAVLVFAYGFEADAQDVLPFGSNSGVAATSYVSTSPIATQQELDQMLAPVALYPDSLLSQILMASTYPLEVVQAARWSRANPSLTGKLAVRAVDNQNWDPSVKSLTAFPQLLQMMDASLDWTERLGDTFLSQESQIWDTVQTLRQRADTAGNLSSNDEYRVTRDSTTYIIDSPSPDIIYVPYYDPLIVYGNWWWPGYAPMRWAPWSGYAARRGYGNGYYWRGGISIGSGFFFGGINWRDHHADIINPHTFYYRDVNPRSRPGLTLRDRENNNDGRWQHDVEHRRGVPYRNPVLRQQFGAPGASARFNQRSNPTGNPGGAPRLEGAADSRNVRNNSGTPNNGNDYRGRLPIDRTSNFGPRQTAPNTNSVNPANGANTKPAPKPRYTPGSAQLPTRVDSQRPQLLEGLGNAQGARDASARGHASYPPNRVNTTPPRAQGRDNAASSAPILRGEPRNQSPSPQSQERQSPPAQQPQRQSSPPPQQPQQRSQQAPSQPAPNRAGPNSTPQSRGPQPK
jgi:hypothetical protein